MKKIALTLAALFMALFAASAQTPAATSGMEPQENAEELPWYLNLDYGGFSFEIPAGSVVEKTSTLLARYPDGSFGISMSNQEVEGGSFQKRAYELCRMLSEQMKIEDAKVKKETIGGVKGARATGKLEGQEVSIIILPNGTQELTTVILASDNRKDWVDHFVNSLKK